MQNFVVRKTIDIRAAASRVWDAITNPEKTRKYFFHCRVGSDWKPGSNITFKGRIFLFMKVELKGRIVNIEPEKYLKYVLRNASDKGGSLSTVTFQLSPANGITTLNVEDDVGQGPGAEKRYKRSDKAWDKVLNGMKKLVEEEAGLSTSER